jgi:hypothetical protein
VNAEPAALGSPVGRLAAYSALALGLVGLPLIGVSEGDCRWDPEANNYVSYLTEPGATGGGLAYTLAPVLAIVALVLFARARGDHRGRRPRLAVAAAVVVFPLAALNFLFSLAKGAFGCGFF